MLEKAGMWKQYWDVYQQWCKNKKDKDIWDAVPDQAYALAKHSVQAAMYFRPIPPRKPNEVNDNEYAARVMQHFFDEHEWKYMQDIAQCCHEMGVTDIGDVKKILMSMATKFRDQHLPSRS